jgi:two-component system, LytTR family, sensor kinase
VSPRVDRRRTRIYWLCQGLGWTSYLAAWLALSVYVRNESRRAALVQGIVTASSVVLSIAWTHGYRALIRRAGWTALSPARLLPRIAIGSAVVGVAIAASSIPLAPLYGSDAAPLAVWLPWAIATSSVSVALWSVAYFAVHYFERWRQAERDKLALEVHAAEAKLHFLVSQLNPHFLFNSLSSVRALIAEDPAKAHTALTALSQILRYSLRATELATVPLADELDMIATYLSLETIRFEERLRSRIDAAADTRAVPIPPMLIQTLVENGVKHGIERLPAGGELVVEAWREAGALRVRVTNPRSTSAAPDSTRVGLRNARERLRLLHGDRASLVVHEGADLVTAELALPAEDGAR